MTEAECVRPREEIEVVAIPRAAGDAAPDSLPCLSSNNSTETKPQLSPYQRKNAFILSENLQAAIDRYGVEKLGFLTLTFPKHLSLKEANKRFNSLASHILNDLFVCWICVREFTSSLRPHFHLVVVCHEDIREGFNFDHYLEMVMLSRNPRRRRKFHKDIKYLARNLNPSPHLRHVWKVLRSALPKYGFGRHELIPIRKPYAIARYVGGYIRKSNENRPKWAKGARLITYSKSFNRKVNGHSWQWNTDGSYIWRRKLALFAKIHSIKSYEGLSKRLGPRWAWWFGDIIESLNLLAFPDFIKPQDYATFVNSIDYERLSQYTEHGHQPNDMHMWRPKLPYSKEGKPLSPPQSLHSYISFHMINWNKAPV